MQDFLAPELRAIRGEIAVMNEKFLRLEEKINSNHREVMNALNLDKRMAILEDRQQRKEPEAKDAAQ